MRRALRSFGPAVLGLAAITTIASLQHWAGLLLLPWFVVLPLYGLLLFLIWEEPPASASTADEVPAGSNAPEQAVRQPSVD